MQRREQRLAVIAAAKQRLEEQARAEAEAERQRRAEAEAERQRSGKKRRGKEPKPVSDVPDDKAQTSFTDPELKMMPQSNKGWDYSRQRPDQRGRDLPDHRGLLRDGGGQRPATGGAAGRRRRGRTWSRPAWRCRSMRPGEAQKIPVTADTGYFSAAAVAGLEAAGFDPVPGDEAAEASRGGGGGAGVPLPAEATAKERMAAKVNTPAGRALYARRKVIVEPVFGQIKGARGFRRFSLRGLEKINGEWRLVCLTHNLLKVWRYGCALNMN